MQATPSSSSGGGAGTGAPGGAAAAPGAEVKKKGTPTWVGCLIGCGVVTAIIVVLLVVLGIVGAIAIPNFVSAKLKAQTKGCFAVQRIITASMEMHEIDKGSAITELTPSTLETLKDEGYLMEIPEDPGAGPGSSGNYTLVTVRGEDRPVVFCVRHGFRDRPAGCAEDASPAEQLRAAGVDDDALLGRASNNAPGVD